MGNFESLDNTFDITPEVVIASPTEAIEKANEAIKPLQKEFKKHKAITISDKSEDREKDYQHTRASLYNIADKMQEALDGALEVAQQSDHPRAYEVALAGAKSAAEVVEKLTDLHKKMKDLEAQDVSVNATQNNNNSTTNNVFFSGSTEEMMKMIKDANKAENK
jgi:hypothetical protein